MNTITLTPDVVRSGEHAYLVVKDRSVMIRGEYSPTLNLVGVQVEGGRLYAEDGSTAPNVFLSGASIPDADLRDLSIREGLYGQGLRSRRLRLGEIGRELDLTWSRIDALDLSQTVSAHNIHLNLRGALIGDLYFGNDPNFKFHHLDMRGTRISHIHGPDPAEIHYLKMDNETTVGEDFAKYLKAVKEYLERQGR